MDLHLQIQPRHIEQDGGLLHVIGADQTDVFRQRGDDSAKLFSPRQHFNSLLCSRPRCSRNPELGWDNLCVKSQNLARHTVDVWGINFVQRVAGRSIIEVSYSMPTVERIDGGRQASGFAREACEDETAAGVAHHFAETEARIT